jgi:hypothetical protein
VVGWRGVLASQAARTRRRQLQGFGCEPLLFLLYNGVLYLWLYSPEEHHVHYLWKVIVRLIGHAEACRMYGMCRTPPRLDAATHFGGFLR